MEVRPAARPEARPEARSDGRRPDARPAAETRAKVQPAPAAQPAPASRGNRQATRPEPGERHEAPQAGEAATRQDSGADPMGRTRTGR